MWYLIVSFPDLCHLSYFVDMNMFARFDEIPPTTLQDIKETERYGRMDNVKKYTPQTQFVGYKQESDHFGPLSDF